MALAESSASNSPRLADLASRFAHGIRNPLNTLSLTLQFVERLLSRESDLRAREEIERHLRTASEEAERIRRLVGAFVELSRERRPSLLATDLGDLARAAIDDARAAVAAAGGGTTPPVEAVLEPTPVLADAKLLREALAAVVQNAFEAGGAQAPVVVRVEPREGGGGRASVRDGGPGFAPVALARGREPFFTTKAGRLGVGLPLAEAVVAAHGGRLDLHNDAKGGAEVVIELDM